MFLEVTGERQIPEGDFRFLPDGTKVLPYGRSARKGRSSTRTVGQNRSFTENQCTFEFANGGVIHRQEQSRKEPLDEAQHTSPCDIDCHDGLWRQVGRGAKPFYRSDDGRAQI